MSNIYDNYRKGKQGKSNKYVYITSSDELIKAYADSRKDLHDWVRKEVKRDRYVESRAALQASIYDTVIQAITEGSYLVANAAADNAADRIVAALNNKPLPNNTSFISTLGNAIGKGIGQAPFRLLDEIFKELED